ncbi:MAG: Stk1 family PASTA domain-containing Ser/Thr kinase [Clostridia bacterium]
MENELLQNRYQLLEMIGSGGMAYVYKAHDNTLDRVVAVKVLKEEFIEDEDFVKRFQFEAQAVAKLSHANIVQVFDVGQSDGKNYIVMEYIEGITLSEYIAGKKKVSWEEGVMIAGQISSALSHAHKNNIIHRDIKPQNIIIDGNGDIKVADFGIAKAISEKTHTLSEKTMGSVHYLSPEQARGGFIDHRTDIYSLGVVLYEMLTGQLPFEGETSVIVALKHLQQPPVPPIRVNGKIPQEVNAIILKAMEKSVDDRYQTIHAMHNELKKLTGNRKVPVMVDLSLDFMEINDIIAEDMQRITKDFDPVEAVQEKREEYDIPLAGSKGYQRRKKHRISTFLAILSAMGLIVLISYYGVTELINTFVPKPAEYEVRNYIGWYYDDISLQLMDDFRIISEKQEVYDDRVPAGIIMDQEPKAGIVFKEMALNKIRFTVSLGPELITMLPFNNFQYRVAEMDMLNMNLRPVKIEQNNDLVSKGYVIRTDPEAGMRVSAGEEVRVYVSLGPLLEEVEIPDFVGMELEPAKNLIESMKLVLADVTPKNVSSSATIIRQYPYAGEKHYEGTEIYLVMRDTVKVEYPYDPPEKSTWTKPVTIRVETISSDTRIPYAYNIENRTSDHFPLLIEVVIPYGESVQVKIFIDFVLNRDIILHYSDYAGGSGGDEDAGE